MTRQWFQEAIADPRIPKQLLEFKHLGQGIFQVGWDSWNVSVVGSDVDKVGNHMD